MRAVRRSCGSAHSTMPTRNCRGRQKIAAAASAVVISKSAGNACASEPSCVAEMGGADSRCSMAKTPTAANANSLTIDSKAMASITPSWCSVASSRRVPKSMANAAIIRATHRAVSAYHAGFAPSAPVSTSMLVPTALYWSARYGTPAVSAITATSAASVGLLPKRDEIRSAIEVMLWARTIATSRCRNGMPNSSISAGPR